MNLEHDRRQAERHLANLGSMLRRIDRDGWGRNSAATENGLVWHAQELHRLLPALKTHRQQDRARALVARVNDWQIPVRS
jgi:hypothetical protein